MKKVYGSIVLVLAALALAGCGQGMNSKNQASQKINQGEQGGGGSPGVSLDVQKVVEESQLTAEEAAAEAEEALEKAQNVLGDVNVGGDGRISIGASGQLGQQLIVDQFLRKALDKVSIVLDLVPEKFNMARALVADTIARLDSTNPAHQSAIAALMLAMAKIDELEGRYHELLEKVADKIDFLKEKIDQVVSKLDPKNPLTWIVMIEVESVKLVLTDFQTKLRSYSI